MFGAKSRYLELNGDDIVPDRHSDVRQELKSHFKSVAFSTILITQGLNLALNDNPSEGLMAFPGQVIACLMLRDGKKDILDRRFFNNNGKVFDTNPSNQNPTNPNDLENAHKTKRNEISCCLIFPTLFYGLSQIPPLSFITALLGYLPLATETLASTYRMHQVTQGKWAIIDRDQIKKTEEKVPVKSGLKLSNALSPAQT